MPREIKKFLPGATIPEEYVRYRLSKIFSIPPEKVNDSLKL